MCIKYIDKPAAPVPSLHDNTVFEVARKSDRIADKKAPESPRLVTALVSGIRQFLQDEVNRKASLPDQCGASQLGLVARICARDTHSDIFCAKKQMVGRRRRVQIKNKLALKDAIL